MERDVQLLEGTTQAPWPFHMMATAAAAAATTSGCCFDDYSSSSSSGSDCFVLGWEEDPAPPPFGSCFGVLAADVHGLFPLCFAGMESPLPVSSAPVAAPPPPGHDDPITGDLDDLLLNFWDAGCCHDGDVAEPLSAQQQQQQETLMAAFNSSCVTHEQACCTTTNSFALQFLPADDDSDDPLSSIFSAGASPAAESAAAFQSFQGPAGAAAEPLPSSSSSDSRGGPQGAAATATATPRAARARTPPLPRSSASRSLKRAIREEPEAEACSQSGGGIKRSKVPTPAVVCPFALLKPDGLDGGATLADINARLLMRPARPVRHPVGEFACAPRVSADQPGISGKAVSSFTRLHTPGRGTITIIRTRG